MNTLIKKSARITLVLAVIFALSLNMTAFAAPKHNGKKTDIHQEIEASQMAETEAQYVLEVAKGKNWTQTDGTAIRLAGKSNGKIKDKTFSLPALRLTNNQSHDMVYTVQVVADSKAKNADAVAWSCTTEEGTTELAQYRMVVSAGETSEEFTISGTADKTAMVNTVAVDVVAEEYIPSPYYAINTDTDIVIDEQGKTVVLNSDQQDYLASVSGQKVTFQNVTITGTTEALMFGQYRNGTYGYFNNELNNVTVKDLVVTNGVYNGKDTISNGVYFYGTSVLNNCTVTGTTSTAEGFNVYDIGFVNKANATINGGTFGNVYVWSQAHVGIYGAEIEKIDCSTITTRNLGMLTIGSGTHVGTINLTTGGWTQYKPALTIEEGAVVDQICYNGKTYTQKQWTSPLRDKYISVLGDSISTYTGWSDVNPITDESCTNRYGEAYYGPEGGDFHNTDLLVTDTWWHQAATELGAEILISNAGNSTGVLKASYPANAAWDLYLKEMLAYKSRPYYLGTAEHDPDIIALYIGSNEVARCTASEFGSIEDVDFETLIVKNDDGSYTYATPVTVAEAYSIMLHKIQVTYPNAEIYCITPVPNAGGYLKTVNSRLPNAISFNNTLRGVADYYGATIVDIFDEFGIDPDLDGVATQEAFDYFQSCFNNDPHPNAQGFDVITKRFVETVLENSKYNK